jgi:peptidoglycan hydrolase-like protein with peptidoglycan-binding domain
VFKTSTRRTQALEQRLRALGYFSGTPDEYFDDYTRYAVRQFQISQELPALPYADAATLKALDAAIEALREEIVYIDTQFEKAHELALETAELPFDQVLPRRDFTDN